MPTSSSTEDQTSKSEFLSQDRIEALYLWTRDQGHLARILRMGDPTIWDDLTRALVELGAFRVNYLELKARMDGLEK